MGHHIGGDSLGEERQEGKREWIYKSTAMKLYKLTRHQIETAIEMGLVEAREVKNPHYSSKTAVLVRVSDIEANLETIRGFPKHSELEAERRKTHYMRRKLRDKLEFLCPRCGERIRAPRGSAAFEEVFEGDLDLEEARKLLMIAHYRHTHTDYEKDLMEHREKRYRRYRELRDEGYDYEEAWLQVNMEFAEEYEEMKKKHNKIAIDMLIKDGLLGVEVAEKEARDNEVYRDGNTP